MKPDFILLRSLCSHLKRMNDEKTATHVISFLDENRMVEKLLVKFIEVRVTKETEGTLMRLSGEDTWLVAFYLKCEGWEWVKKMIQPLSSLIHRMTDSEDFNSDLMTQENRSLIYTFVTGLIKKMTESYSEINP